MKMNSRIIGIVGIVLIIIGAISLYIENKKLKQKLSDCQSKTF